VYECIIGHHRGLWSALVPVSQVSRKNYTTNQSSFSNHHKVIHRNTPFTFSKNTLIWKIRNCLEFVIRSPHLIKKIEVLVFLISVEFHFSSSHFAIRGLVISMSRKIIYFHNLNVLQVLIKVFEFFF